MSSCRNNGLIRNEPWNASFDFELALLHSLMFSFSLELSRDPSRAGVGSTRPTGA